MNPNRGSGKGKGMTANIFKAAKDVLEDQKKMELLYLKEMEKVCDWDDPSDIAEYRASLTLKKRLDLLDKLVPTRHCPVCGELKISPRSWVINKRKSKAICRSCFAVHLGGREGERHLLKGAVFGEKVVRVVINGEVLEDVRREAGITRAEFARKGGWSKSYQSKLEQGDVRTITSEMAEIIEEVFAEYNLMIEDTL